MNGSVNSVTRKSPHYTVFGSDKRLTHDLLTASPVSLIHSIIVQRNKNAFAIIYADIRDKLVALQDDMIHQQHHEVWTWTTVYFPAASTFPYLVLR